MGYDLHITRRRSWSDTGADITAAEWHEWIRRDPELELHPDHGPYFAVWRRASAVSELWLDWSDGQIFAKNPPPALIEKMIAIADQLAATVQGDDGERYDSGTGPPRPARVSSWRRIAGWFGTRRAPRALDIDHSAFPLRPGDRVRDLWGREASVISVDPSATHGLGLIKVRYDDGREVGFSMTAHPFQKTGAPE